MAPLRPWLQVPRDERIADETQNFFTWVQATLNTLIGTVDVLPAPTGFTAASLINAIRFVWNEVPGAGSYLIYESRTASMPTTPLVSVLRNPQLTGTTNNYIRSGLTDSTVHYYWIQSAAPSGKLGGVAGPFQATAILPSRGVVAQGKNLVANPGFESNTTGTAYSNLNISPNVINELGLGVAATDNWYVFSKSAYHQPVIENGGIVHSGANNLAIRFKTNVTLPNDNVNYECRVLTQSTISAIVGDVIRVRANIWQGQSIALPAGVTYIQRVGLFIYDANLVFLGELNADYTGAVTSAYQTLQGALQVPATLGARVPAYFKVQCSAFINNNSGAPLPTGSNLYLDLRWDDIAVVSQNTAFEVTPINTSGTFSSTTSPLAQSGTTTTINVGASTFQFGDGTVAYSAGSVNPGSLGTWYVYADDPTFAGGAVTYQATANPWVTVAGNGRIFFGKITTTAGGSQVGTGGGTGGGGPSSKGALV